MSVLMNTSAHNVSSTYTPTDVIERHEYGIQKNRKLASTGGGRAWSEEEEVYLLQTRLQKMPYKHIAAHLKKTELACRLHYHQLSHGSNRRKRTSSVSSRASSDSPVNMPSPIYESTSRPDSPASFSYSPQIQQVQLPPAASLLSRPGSSSPHRVLGQPIAILPKPSSPRQLAATPPLRLDCSLPETQPIDQKRLSHIYEAHRASFWGVISAEYGHGASPLALEEAWLSGHNAVSSKVGVDANAPPTPCVSPEGGNAYQQEEKSNVVEHRSNATSISALLGIDASPRSPDERELVKRIEEGRMEVV